LVLHKPPVILCFSIETVAALGVSLWMTWLHAW